MLPPTVAMFLICGDAVSDAACAMAGAAAVQKRALGKLGERHRRTDDELAVLFLPNVQLRNFLQEDEILVVAHLVFQQRHDVCAAADVGRVLGGDDVV